MTADPLAAPRGALAVAAATRRLMDVLVRTRSADEELLESAGIIDALADRLGADIADTMPWPTLAEMAAGLRPYNPVHGELNPYAPPVRWRVLADLSVEGTVTMAPLHEGPPGAVHGGLVAALLDQMLGQANVSAGVGGMTAELTVRYLRPTPYGVPLIVRARHDRAEGRRVFASGEVSFDDVVTARATGVFVQPSTDRRAQLAAMLEEPPLGDTAAS